MKTVDVKTKEKALPDFIINKSLNQYKDKILFPEKLAKANEMLRTIGLPKEFKQ